jgi:hypothetical protein
VPIGAPTLTLDGNRYRIEGDLDSTQVSVSTTTTTTKDDEPHQDDPDEDLPPEPQEVDDPTPQPEAVPGPDDPDVQDAKVQIITIDTDDPQGAPAGSQGASDSEPDTESDDDVYDSTQPDDVSLAATLTDTLDSFEATATALVETRRQLGEVTEERDAARRERDEVAEMAMQVIGSTSQIIERLASMPVGRKAVIREAKDELSGLERLYGPEIIKLIRSNKDNG